MSHVFSLKGSGSSQLLFNLMKSEDMLFMEGDLECDSWLHKAPLRIDGPISSAPCLAKLEKVTQGESEAYFELSTTVFSLRLFNGSWGIRTGTIAECQFSSVGFQKWPDSESLSRHLLDDNDFVSLVRTAFLVDLHSLEQFHRQLKNFNQSQCSD